MADGDAVVAGDFRIDPDGRSRFAVLCRPDIQPRRLGRIVQRLLEIELDDSCIHAGITRADAKRAAPLRTGSRRACIVI